MHSPSAALVWSPCQSTRLTEMKTIKNDSLGPRKSNLVPRAPGKSALGTRLLGNGDRDLSNRDDLLLQVSLAKGNDCRDFDK